MFEFLYGYDKHVDEIWCEACFVVFCGSSDGSYLVSTFILTPSSNQQIWQVLKICMRLMVKWRHDKKREH
ncbi:hypothetical protein SDJN02_07217, partial [Cucurbita argyrosperma subsp. argyrosperma]